MEARMKLIFILVVCFHIADGELRFASYYGDHMVLQRSPEKVALWGYGPEGVVVTVYLSGPSQQNRSAETVKDGVWRVSLDPVEAGGPYNVTAVCENSTATLTDVLFGDIWLCGGQSNMAFATSRIFNSSEELILTAKYPHVRTFMVARDLSDTELADLLRVDLPWSVPTSATVAKFSAVCWLFGRYLYDTLKYPIGLVESCWGGTPVEPWSSVKALRQCGLDYHDQSVQYRQHRNSLIWNAMIHPLLKMTIKGAIWYQGESNANYHQDKYNCSFPAMIDDWRMAFHQGSGGQTAPDFPFGFVQLSTFKRRPVDESFPNIRWHQTADHGFAPNIRMQKTFMAVAMDLPDETSSDPIHPRNKQDVAYRLTLGARAVAYNESDVTFQGPFPSEILSTPTYINITYDQTLYVTPSADTFQVCCSESQAPCGPDSTWVAAPITNSTSDSVQLSLGDSCSSAEEVAALRYAWRDWPCRFKACPIYSASRVLPAPPFIVSRYAATTTWKHSRPVM